MTRASVLVALATTGAVPKASNVGNVTSVPQPATALMAPPATAAKNNPAASVSDMLCWTRRFRPPRPPKFCRCGPRIIMALAGWRANDFRRDSGIDSLAEAHQKGLFDPAIFAGMKAETGNTPPWTRA